MELSLFLAAAACLLIGGFGAAALAFRERRQLPLGELVGAGVLLGILAVTLAWWGISLLVPGRWGVGLVSALSLALGGAGLAAWRRSRPEIVGVPLYCILVLPLTAWIAWTAATTPLGWDGLFIWEMKADAIAAEGGPPWSYFQDDSRAWSHPVYPLLVPFSRAWFKVWMGGPHEAYAKLAGVLFFLGAASLAASLASRLGTAAVVTALALLVLTPLEILGPGSATSGYADFPLAVYYLGAVLYLFYAAGPGESGDLRIAGWLAAALPWTKQEGKVLLAALLVLALLVLGRRAWRQILSLAVPGTAVLLAWWAFVTVNRVESAVVFSKPSLALLLDRLHLADDIGKVMLRLTFDPAQWGLLWILFPLAVLLRPRADGMRRTLFLALAVLLPLAVFTLPYFFSLWKPVTLHVESSFSRLLIPLSFPAIVLIAWKTTALLAGISGLLPAKQDHTARNRMIISRTSPTAANKDQLP